jgi:hypothetical protein
MNVVANWMEGLLANIKSNVATATGRPPDADPTQTGAAAMAEQAKIQAVPDSVPAPETTPGAAVPEHKTGAPAPETPAPNPFDPAKLRLNLNVTEGLGVKKVLATVPVRKPNGQEFIRVHSYSDYRLTVGLIELKDEREVYLVHPDVAPLIPGEFFPATIYTAINRAGIVFLWPVRLPGTDGRRMRWHTSAAEAAEAAMKRWVRVKANMGLGAYEWWEASSKIPDPTWPGLTLQQLLEIAFKGGMLVDSIHHSVLAQLRGD